jgi:DNA-binding GntR family transcriptional regulator
MDTSPVRSPVYQQLNQRLRAALAAEYRSGDQFLTEWEVAEKFQVSRTTANKSLASLVSEGFLEFRKGLGTFVRRDVIDYDVRSLVSFTEKARAGSGIHRLSRRRFATLVGANALSRRPVRISQPPRPHPIRDSRARSLTHNRVARGNGYARTRPAPF